MGRGLPRLFYLGKLKSIFGFALAKLAESII
jgi:hypothetical protein